GFGLDGGAWHGRRDRRWVRAGVVRDAAAAVREVSDRHSGRRVDARRRPRGRDLSRWIAAGGRWCRRLATIAYLHAPDGRRRVRAVAWDGVGAVAQLLARWKITALCCRRAPDEGLVGGRCGASACRLDGRTA